MTAREADCHSLFVLQAQQRSKPIPAQAYAEHEGSTHIDLIQQLQSLNLGSQAAPAENGGEHAFGNGVSEGADLGDSRDALGSMPAHSFAGPQINIFYLNLKLNINNNKS